MLRKLMEQTWRLPPGYIPSDQGRFLRSHRYRNARWLLKYLKRLIFFVVFVQKFGRAGHLNQISSEALNILWINRAAPSLGDAIMDLSARSLLKDRRVTLLTHQKNADLFMNDEAFDVVVSDHRELIGRSFDLVICDSFSPRVLNLKRKVAPNTDFVGLYGFLNGFEIHRTYFAWARMKELLGLTISSCPDLDAIVKVTNFALDKTTVKVSDIVIAVGGEWTFRTYTKWHEVVDELLRKGFSVRLVGSRNGQMLANQISAAFPVVDNFVAKTSIGEAVSLISRSRLFIGADGGLWHCAVGLGVPSVALFADCELFDDDGRRVTRETVQSKCLVLYARDSVERISVDEIVGAVDHWFGKHCSGAMEARNYSE